MRIIIAFSEFKGFMSARQMVDKVASYIKKSSSSVKIKKFALSDGGKGTVDILLKTLGGKKFYLKAHGPYAEEIKAYWGFNPISRTGYFEIAAASGIALLPRNKRDPYLTTTYGTGELIRYAVENYNLKNIILGLGDSATVDGGMGCLSALGVKFYNSRNELLKGSNQEAGKVVKINKNDIPQCIKNVNFVILCDVSNTLFGKKGGVYTYAPQKGAMLKDLPKLEKNLKHFVYYIQKYTNIQKDIGRLKFTGAAGGVGAGLLAFFKNVKLTCGADFILELLSLKESLRNSDILIVGEGKLDRTSFSGKVIGKIIKMANRMHVPVIAVVGKSEFKKNEFLQKGICDVWELSWKKDINCR